jgi:alkanesulfonate monooxygenase SsuD/methylene tetrahydromethanopterin reductase-like flavin-dependent oxidoreductase (luciferase family)
VALKFDAMLPAQPLRRAGELGRRAADAGFSGLVVTEAGRTAYLTCGALAVAADIDILTGIAVAFPRSPMITAATAWELAEASNGRFRLGLGAQVRAHIERRYGAAFDPPGPRMREYVVAVKQIFESFRTGGPLAVDGEFYALSLLPTTWSPGAIDCADPPIDVAAVNPWMLRMVGEYAPPPQLADLPQRDRPARAGGGGGSIGPTRRRARGHRAGLPRGGRHGRGAEEVVGDGAGAGRVLRFDAQLRLHLRTA